MKMINPRFRLSRHMRFAVLMLDLAASVALPACASDHHQDPHASFDISAIEEIEVKTSGASIETDFMTVPFEGQILLRLANGAQIPSAEVHVYRQDPRRGEPYGVTLALDQDGHFSEQVTLLVCRSGRHEWPHWPTFIFTAPGCTDARVTLSGRSRPYRITMSCSD
jgi:hypothetical protein